MSHPIHFVYLSSRKPFPWSFRLGSFLWGYAPVNHLLSVDPLGLTCIGIAEYHLNTPSFLGAVHGGDLD